MTYTHVVKKLIGPIQPVGESNEDKNRLKNLEDMCELVEDLMLQIREVAKSKSNHQYSVKKIGEKANSFLAELFENVEKPDPLPENGAPEKIILHGEVIFEIATRQDLDKLFEGGANLPIKLLNEEWLWLDSERNLLVNSQDFNAADEKGTFPCKLYRVKSLSKIT